jgi:6-phosphogluconate dehydrogenase
MEIQDASGRMMTLGMVGLGKMGANMALRLLRGGHVVAAFDLNEAAVRAITGQGARGAGSLEELAEILEPPRSVWVMLPSGVITEQAVVEMAGLLAPGDTLIDGGNSNYKDTQRRAALLQEKGIDFIDVGTSGGVWGLAEGYSLMIGGEAQAVERHRPIFETLAPGAERGWGYVGPSGAGHFVKMVHNGIEYGMMQAYAEGFEILHAKEELALDLPQIAEIWRYGSVVRSWLLDLTARALAENPNLEGIKAWVADSGEGRWTVAEAIDLDVPAPVITLALQSRFRSRSENSFADRLLAAMRNQFGGHEVKKD